MRYGVEFIDLPIMAANFCAKNTPPAVFYSSPVRMALYVLRHFGPRAMLGFARMMAFCVFRRRPTRRSRNEMRRPAR